MRSFDSISLSKEDVDKATYIQSLYDDPDNEEELLYLRPPTSNGGISQSQELMKVAFYTEDEKKSFFKRYNTSDICGFEIWYQDGDIEFYWYVPNETTELHYRRFLDSTYKKGEIGSTLDKFVDVRETDYLSGAQYYLKHHYFEPIKHHRSGSFSNIYKNLLSEVNTKDDSRVVLQVLFKPAEDDWCDLYTKSVEDVADALDTKTKTESSFFGLRKTERPLSSEEKQVPSQIRNQRDEKGYYVNFRVCVLGSDQERIEQEMSEVNDIIQLTFESPSGQNFVPARDSKSELRGLLRDMMLRKTDHMFQPKLPKDYLKYRLSKSYKTIVMTATELASIAHIPNSSEVNVNGIKWSVIEIDGTLPTGAVDFEEPTESEKQQIAERLQTETNTTTKNETVENETVPELKKSDDTEVDTDSKEETSG